MAETVYLHEANDIIRAMEKNNENLINALSISLNNLAKNTGNKTTKEYNELKTKYEELEKKYSKADSLLKSIITIYVATLVNHGYPASNSSDNVVHIMDDHYKALQEHSNEHNWMYKSLFDVSNEVYEKLTRR